ncbi:MAG: protein-glutamate methylesterase/protein-glutamine glutaminase [Phycisphaerales bacterium]
MVRVLVIDDSAFMRQAIKSMLSADGGIEVVGTGRNGKEALELNERLRPDVITLDIEMPEMDGLTALERIMRERPTRVIMVSSLTTAGSHAAMRALALGAADVVAKDGSQISLSIQCIRDELLLKVKELGAAQLVARRPARRDPASLPEFSHRSVDVVAIGSSTGGPAALETILSLVPAGFSPAIVVAQHMPGMFTESMAQRLDEVCRLPVVHVVDRMPLLPGRIHIAKGGMHMHVRRASLAAAEVAMSDQPATAVYRPSVDVLLSSAAAVFGAKTLGIVLTGIGQDGLAGAKELRNRGGRLWAQDQASSVVYGMPKAVTEQGLVEVNLDPASIGRALAAGVARAAA